MHAAQLTTPTPAQFLPAVLAGESRTAEAPRSRITAAAAAQRLHENGVTPAQCQTDAGLAEALCEHRAGWRYSDLPATTRDLGLVRLYLTAHAAGF